jgi:hypothetical protein
VKKGLLCTRFPISCSLFLQRSKSLVTTCGRRTLYAHI